MLARLEPAARDDADEYSFSPPHERALAAALGLARRRRRPALRRAPGRADGVAIGERAWGLVTPAHWLLGATTPPCSTRPGSA